MNWNLIRPFACQVEQHSGDTNRVEFPNPEVDDAFNGFLESTEGRCFFWTCTSTSPCDDEFCDDFERNWIVFFVLVCCFLKPAALQDWHKQLVFETTASQLFVHEALKYQETQARR